LKIKLLLMKTRNIFLVTVFIKYEHAHNFFNRTHYFEKEGS
jgi:hypothetical protein